MCSRRFPNTVDMVDMVDMVDLADLAVMAATRNTVAMVDHPSVATVDIQVDTVEV